MENYCNYLFIETQTNKVYKTKQSKTKQNPVMNYLL